MDTTAGPPPGRIVRLGHAPLVGRDDELGLLMDCLDDVRTGQAGVVLLARSCQPSP